MKKIVIIVAIVAIGAIQSVTAQTTRYETDSTCGCDILYIDGIQTTRDGVRYGFKRDDGSVVAPNKYLHVGEFKGGYCRVWLEDTLCGILSASGEEVVPCLYDNADLPSCGRVLVVKNGRYGFSDLHGNLVIPTIYSHAYNFSNNRAAVTIIIDSFFYQDTFIDTLGNLLFSTHYETAMPFSDGYAPVKKYERWGLIDTLGHTVLPTVYENITFPEKGIFFAGNADGMALYSLTNLKSAVQKTEPVYFAVTAPSDNRVGVTRDGKQGFLDLQGREVIPCIYDEIGLFRQGRTMVRQGKNFGIIDTLGRIILPIEYEDKTSKGYKYVYHDSLALVERDGLLGYVDLDGQIVIPLRFKQAYHFSQGLAPVLFNGHWGYINTHGDIYMPFIFDIASPFQWERAEVYFQGRRHKIDLEGHCLSNCNGIISFR